MTTRALAILAPLLFASLSLAQGPESPPLPELPAAVAAGRLTLQFRSGFWINLHHVLYAQAFARRPQDRTPDWELDLPDDLRPTWDEAVAYYAETFAAKDLLFDRDLARIDLFLSDAGSQDALPDSMHEWPELADRLQRVAPIYRVHAWPTHDAINHRHFQSLLPALNAHGPDLASALTDTFQQPWPDKPIIVDLLIYANWAGAYTSFTRESGHIRLGAPTEPVDTALASEVLWHEASHLLTGRASPIHTLIAEASEAEGIDPPKDLWHAVIFYNAGQRMIRSGIAGADYAPYADRFGLYTRAPEWSRYRDALAAHWPAYLDGSRRLDETIRAVIHDLATGQ